MDHRQSMVSLHFSLLQYMTLNYEIFLFLPLVLSVNSLEQKCFLSNRETFYHRNPGYVKKRKNKNKQQSKNEGRHDMCFLCCTYVFPYAFHSLFHFLLSWAKETIIKAKSEASIHLGHSWFPLRKKKTKEFLIC